MHWLTTNRYLKLEIIFEPDLCDCVSQEQESKGIIGTDLQTLSRLGESMLTTASDSCSWLTKIEPDVVFC